MTMLRWMAALVVPAVTLATALPAPVQAGAQGGLRAADAVLVRDADRWVSLVSGESLGLPGATACAPGDPVWTKGFAHIPYRIGATPDQLGGCWSGDAMPDGPAPWADRAAESVRSPSAALAGGVWWMAYTARKSGSTQTCIGYGASNRPTGPGWFHGPQPLVCPADGSSAGEPDFFYDRGSTAWYLLWRQNVGSCGTRILLQRFDPVAGTLTGTQRQLLSGDHPAMGFDEVNVASCPGGRRHLIDSPAMMRAADGNLWLFFGANTRDSANYGTGWAICGNGSPTSGAGCALVNAFNPADRYRPAWGSSTRTAAQPGANAKPYLGFPDIPGFGGLSLATADPAGSATQPVFAAAHMWWGGASALRTQFTLRMDITGTVPALYESDVVTIHGRGGAFGNDLPAGSSPSGHRLATRGVPGWGWPAGHIGIFSAVTAQGVVAVQGGRDTTVADDYVAAGIYDPKTNQWTNVKAKTALGFDSVTPIVEGGQTFHGGADSWDVQVVGDGNAVAFTNLFGVPWQSYLERKRIPPEGVWPSFGIISNVNGTWQVSRQWTAAQLANSNPESDVDERACTPYQGLPNGTSLCGGLNEMALFPRSRDVIVALYAGDGARTSGGLMAIRIIGPDAGGRYDARVVGYYAYPEVRDIEPPDPLRPGNLGIALKSVEVDPTGVIGDERFNVVADIWHADNDGKPETIPPALDPSVTQEFSYDSRTGAITPVSAPFIAGLTPDGSAFRGTHGGIYDSQGNLWAVSNGMAVYATTDGRRKLGGPSCPFDLNRWNTQPHTFTTTALGRTVWGQTCAPDYDILQGANFGGGGYFPSFPQMAEDPVSKTVVAVDTWTTGNVISIRHTGNGPNKTFSIGNMLDTGRNLLPRQGLMTEQRPPVFDRTGRMWVTFHQWPRTGQTGVLDHWIASVDIDRLFNTDPITLAGNTNGVTTIQAEQTVTTTTQRRPARPDGTVPIDSTAFMAQCLATCTADGIPGDGYALGDDSGSGHLAGTVEYRVFVPAAGNYRLAYRVSGDDITGHPNPAITATVGSVSHTTTVNTAGSWQTVTGQTFALTAGYHTIRLSPPTGGGNWKLNWFTMTRL